jgi:hypothetical protein
VKKQYAAALLAVCAVLCLAAQETPGVGAVQTISRQLNSFSPLGEIYVRDLGMTDKNHNGVIDKAADEGYEEFTARYGDADIGFAANGVTYGAANGRLEEPEIVNHYYLNIRFKEPVETKTIESEVSAYIYTNNIPLVWLDDGQGTVMNAVNKALGEGWNEREVTEDEAARMFHRAMEGMRIRGRTGDPAKTGYYTLPEFANRKAGYCFEVAQFGFWFFSELKINSTAARAALTASIQHEIVKLGSGKIVDYFGSSIRYKTPLNRWQLVTPLGDIAEYYDVLGCFTGQSIYYENALAYNKYDIDNIGSLMAYFFNKATDCVKIINLGEFFLEQIDMNIQKLLGTNLADSALRKQQIKLILIMLLVSYTQTADIDKLNHIKDILLKNYPNDKEVSQYLKDFSL